MRESPRSYEPLESHAPDRSSKVRSIQSFAVILCGKFERDITQEIFFQMPQVFPINCLFAIVIAYVM